MSQRRPRDGGSSSALAGPPRAGRVPRRQRADTLSPSLHETRPLPALRERGQRRLSHTHCPLGCTHRPRLSHTPCGATGRTEPRHPARRLLLHLMSLSDERTFTFQLLTHTRAAHSPLLLLTANRCVELPGTLRFPVSRTAQP